MRSSPSKLQDRELVEIRWGRCKLQPADGAPLAAALGPSTVKSFLRLASIDLSDNDLRDDGAVALAGVIGEERMALLKDLYVQSCRVGDRGVAALVASGCAELRTLMLHTNEITDDGLRALGDAIERKRFRCKCLKLHSNRLSVPF